MSEFLQKPKNPCVLNCEGREKPGGGCFIRSECQKYIEYEALTNAYRDGKSELVETLSAMHGIEKARARRIAIIKNERI